MSRLATAPGDLLAAGEQYLERIGQADEFGAVDLVLGLLGDGVPAESLLLELIAPAQRRVGELWAANRWSVAREHGATAVSERAIAAIAAKARPEPALGRITVACTDGEYHALPTRLLAEVLRLRGWRVDFLGASVPGPHLITHLHQTGPDAVALGCALPTRLPRAHATLTACQAVGVPVIVGGSGFGADGRFARLLGADGWAATADAAADRLADTGLPAFPSPRDTLAHLSDEEYTLLTRRRGDLLTGAMATLTAAYPPMAAYTAQQLESTAEDLGHILDFLSAALYVDDTGLFTDFIAWTTGVLLARAVPANAVKAGLRIFHDELRDFPRARLMLIQAIEAAHGADVELEI
ncbi:cobalamin B12-binding domain-containing protein [Streptosporangium carneum]|uniref:Cobalamin-binding protein n=1 Tax=Streptosporangium carneum TaxID=47481 RepID=A0A9W6MHF9_9ACTN|nr:cobalamin B12-binding domain-containing protein [Streptosporangium carneum]GLK13993.1 cobalamin-binding protein [Streptosporangium carneum]